MPNEDHIITTQWGSRARSFAALSDEKRRDMLQHCADWMASIKENTGIDIYLSYGCLLGAVRNGKMISHDFDIDLGFHASGETKEEIVSQCRKLIRYLTHNSHRVKVESNGQFKAAKMFPGNLYLTIEFFVSWVQGDEFFLYFGIPGAKIAKDILPFSEIEIEGVKLPAPSNPEAMVEAIYGSDWKIPNPDFKYDNIDWTPFQGFSVNKNKSHWEDYYSKKTQNDVWTEYPSQFGAFCASEIKPNSRLLDFGCGNGRDSLFLSQIGHDVLACDYSQSAVDLVKAKGEAKDLSIQGSVLNIYDTSNVQMMIKKHQKSFDVIYSRFVMHAITLGGQDRFLRLAKKILKPDGRIFLEFRNSKDERANSGTVLSDDERSDGHYRRFIKTTEFVDHASERGWAVEYLAEGTGFAKFKGEDPNVTRIILTFNDI